MTTESITIVQRLWNYCNVVRDDGVSYGDYVEQLTYLLFIKRLDELHTLRERKAARTKKPIEDPVFTEDQDHLRWSRFKETAPEIMFEARRMVQATFMYAISGQIYLYCAVFYLALTLPLSQVAKRLEKARERWR